MTTYVQEAVRTLRTSKRMTQSQFASALGCTLNTIQRYENVVAPSGKALAKLAKFAAINGSPELTDVFLVSLAAELDLPQVEKLQLSERGELKCTE